MPSPIFAERYGAVVATLTEARGAAGVTQAELAQRLGLPQSYVSKVERRERRVDPIEFLDWGRALGVEPDALLGGLVRHLADDKWR